MHTLYCHYFRHTHPLHRRSGVLNVVGSCGGGCRGNRCLVGRGRHLLKRLDKTGLASNFQQIQTKIRSSSVDKACGLEIPAPFIPQTLPKEFASWSASKIRNPSAQQAWFQRNCLSLSTRSQISPFVRCLKARHVRSTLLALSRLLFWDFRVQLRNQFVKTFTCRDQKSADGGCCTL